MNNDIKRIENESQDQYFYRICKMKDVLGFTWPQMAEIFNEEFGCDYGEAKYRKDWTTFERICNANADKFSGDGKYLEEIKAATDELYKAKRQFYDQRREYNKLLVSDARSDNLVEKLIEAANLVPFEEYIRDDKVCVKSFEGEALLLISDWHVGMKSENIWNEYNLEICKERVNKLYLKTVKALQSHNVNTLHIAILGDMINGALKPSIRVASDENTCEQLMRVSEMLSELIYWLSQEVENVYVYSTYGNHARTIQNKDDSIHADNMERIIPWWIRQRLQNFTNIHVIDSEYYELIYMQICGYNIICSHGDIDRPRDFGQTVNTLFTKKYGKSVDYTFAGHLHHLESFEQFGIESTLVGSLCGTDEFANNKRLYSYPMQTLCIFTPEDGKLCSYNIKL